MRLGQIFQWDIDFVLDIRKGDEFYVVYEELYHNGDEFDRPRRHSGRRVREPGRPAIKAVLLCISTHRANAGYYDPDGAKHAQSLPAGTGRVFSRISSNFNLRRMHPLYKRSPCRHRGIDYAAPSRERRSSPPATAVFEPRASSTKANGNYVVLQHGEQYVTKYLHLSKFAQRRPQSGSNREAGAGRSAMWVLRAGQPHHTCTTNFWSTACTRIRAPFRCPTPHPSPTVRWIAFWRDLTNMFSF